MKQILLILSFTITVLPALLSQSSWVIPAPEGGFNDLEKLGGKILLLQTLREEVGDTTRFIAQFSRFSTEGEFIDSLHFIIKPDSLLGKAPYYGLVRSEFEVLPDGKILMIGTLWNQYFSGGYAIVFSLDGQIHYQNQFPNLLFLDDLQKDILQFYFKALDDQNDLYSLYKFDSNYNAIKIYPDNSEEEVLNPYIESNQFFWQAFVSLNHYRFLRYDLTNQEVVGDLTYNHDHFSPGISAGLFDDDLFVYFGREVIWLNENMQVVHKLERDEVRPQGLNEYVYHGVWDVIKTSDQGYLIGGGAGFIADPIFDQPFLVKINADKQVEWSRMYSFDELPPNKILGIVEIDGRYFVAIYYEYNYYSPISLWLSSINLDGGITSTHNIVPFHDLNIFPNPAQNKINICGLESKTINSYVITTILGKEQISGPIHKLSNCQEIDISTLQKGVYVLHFYNAKNQLIYSKELVKL